VKKLSHLAYITLGVVSEREPCSGYAVMQAFKSSSSTYFSGSAGAIYPLLRRLESSGLIKAEKSQAGTRTRRTYAITAKGKKELAAWLTGPVPDEDVSYIVDLLRARALFFEKLEKPQRKAFVKDARERLKDRIGRTNDQIAKLPADHPFDVVALKSVLLTDEARLRWLDVVERELC